MKGAGISQDEWLTALDEALEQAKQTPRPGPPGLTADEVADARGTHVTAARRMLKRLIESGLWEMKGWRFSVRINGARNRTPVYGPVEDKRGKRKKTK